MTKYTIVASLAFYLLVAKGINNISQKYLKLIIISVIIAFSLVCIRGYYTNIYKEQWRDVAYYIDTDAKNGDLLLFNRFYIQKAFNYYSKRTDLIKKGFRNIKELEPTVEGYKRVWVILSHSRYEKELITKKLIEAYKLSYQKKYRGIKLYFFERRE